MFGTYHVKVESYTSLSPPAANNVRFDDQGNKPNQSLMTTKAVISVGESRVSLLVCPFLGLTLAVENNPSVKRLDC